MLTAPFRIALLWGAFCCSLAGSSGIALGQGADPGRYDVVWSSPSEDAAGSMPLGNGEVGVNAWIEPDGTLRLYLSRTDTWSENGRLLKVGRLRFAVDPPLVTGEGFEQRLDLARGELSARFGGETPARLRVWVDAEHPAVEIEFESERPCRVTASLDLWRTERTPYPACEVSDLLEDRSKPARLHEPIFVEPDTVLADLEGGIGWYHHNARSVGPARIAEIQGLAEYFRGRPDPLLGRTFGAIVRTVGGERLDDRRLRSPRGREHRFRVLVHTEHPATPKSWLEAVAGLEARIDALDLERRRAAHRAWWREFWQRSWIHVRRSEPASPVPANEHPFRVGIDPEGGHRFAGEIGRVSILGRALGAEELAALAASRDADAARALTALRFCAAAPAVGPLEGSRDWAFPEGLTVEAWLRPEALPAAGARILDKITPGSGDGFLLDTFPGNGLRLIVGPCVLEAPNALPPGRWTHVAARVRTGEGGVELFVDGRRVARGTVEAVDDAETVSRAYALQRYVQACAGRGAFPIKYNGSIFTVPYPGRFGDADYRRWGPGYWWQNTRLPYIGMCASGDFDLMRPLFRMYVDQLLPLHVFRTRRYTGHGGAFLPECMYFWGPIFTSVYGWTPFAERGEDKLQQSRWHKREWVGGLELVWMMLDFYEHTEDERFARETLLPAAREFVRFFDEHYSRDENGRLLLEPAQALETWWDCRNPMPEIAGLHAVLAGLLSLPSELLEPQDRQTWERLQTELPDLPTRIIDGERTLAPAERFAEKQNEENPELYAVFPFRLVGVTRVNSQLALAALEHRWDRGHRGWRQDELFMTHLGLAEAARSNLVARARLRDRRYRFPVFFGPNYDWIPDQCHGGVLIRTLQTMLMQTDGRAIHLLPAWPSDWDAEFRLHAPHRTVLTGRVERGRLVRLEVNPPERRADVILHGDPSTRPGPPRRR